MAAFAVLVVGPDGVESLGALFDLVFASVTSGAFPVFALFVAVGAESAVGDNFLQFAAFDRSLSGTFFAIFTLVNGAGRAVVTWHFRETEFHLVSCT